MSSGADPPVCAGPPGPAVAELLQASIRPTRASAADRGSAPLGELFMDTKGIIQSIFGVRRALIGVIHVAALPGTPGSRRPVAEIAEAAAAEARLYAVAGFNGLAIENTHDRPYLKGSVGPEITAAMAVIGAEV